MPDKSSDETRRIIMREKIVKRSEPLNPKWPEEVTELWLLWDISGHWVVAIDGGGDVLMAITSPVEAANEAERQNELYDLNCVPVRVI
jgi:hypothetical protein